MRARIRPRTAPTTKKAGENRMDKKNQMPGIPHEAPSGNSSRDHSSELQERKPTHPIPPESRAVLCHPAIAHRFFRQMRRKSMAPAKRRANAARQSQIPDSLPVQILALSRMHPTRESSSHNLYPGNTAVLRNGSRSARNASITSRCGCFSSQARISFKY